MNDGLLRIYHRLPGPIQLVAASLRGYTLKRWRYGRETDQLVEAALERESWTSAKWKSWQEGHLAFVLDRAATRVPYYREQWARQRSRGNRSSWERLENWPILEKEALRQHGRAFVADDCDPRGMFCDHTSGTTGKPIDIWQSRDTVAGWYALFEARARLWYGVSRKNRWGILGGQMVTPVGRRRPPFWVWNAALNQLYMSSYHLAPRFVPHYLDAIRRYRITYLLGYTSALYALAQEALRVNSGDLGMAVVITNAEPLPQYQREAIAQAFRCPVRETYGMAEIAFAASECGEGNLHAWPEVGVAEIDPDSQPHGDGRTGDLLVTGLLNADMPLVRYRVGDSGGLPSHSHDCKCGRTLPTMPSIEGRSDDLLYTVDGRAIGRLDPVFKGGIAIREAQIIQEALDCVRLRFVPAPEYAPADGREMIRRIRERMGKVEVALEAVTEIPRTRNGKFRAVVCNLPAEDVHRLRYQSALVS
jgi:phenylacetate-coenzyme A ligase PaaK-like adenylate-forming protein